MKSWKYFYVFDVSISQNFGVVTLFDSALIVGSIMCALGCGKSVEKHRRVMIDAVWCCFNAQLVDCLIVDILNFLFEKACCCIIVFCCDNRLRPCFGAVGASNDASVCHTCFHDVVVTLVFSLA